MKTVYTLQEAEDFFIRNSSGNLICIQGDRQVEATCYHDALRFFTNNQEGKFSV